MMNEKRGKPVERKETEEKSMTHNQQQKKNNRKNPSDYI